VKRITRRRLPAGRTASGRGSAGVVRGALVRGALVRGALVRGALVRGALVRGALVPTAAVAVAASALAAYPAFRGAAAILSTPAGSASAVVGGTAAVGGGLALGVVGQPGTQPAAVLAATPSPLAAPAKTATAFNGTAAVGTLFVRESDGKLRHFCTASVVHSTQADLAITAAHCMQYVKVSLYGDVYFAPGFHNGRFPYGLWIVRQVFVDSNWQAHHDANDDFAFIVVGKPGQRIEKKTGAEQLETNFTLPQTVEVVGYPDDTNLPVYCVGPVSRLHLAGYQQLVFDCGGYPDGTSGGPFLTHVSRKTGTGKVIGVIGGYQAGGDTPSISYSARFLDNVANLYKQATATSASPPPSPSPS
jgi:V8-like Glu-specific endopeptidase